MQKFQDTETGLEWHFDDEVVVSELPNAPKSLSANILPKPSEFHEWVGGEWVLNLVKQAKAKNESILAQIAQIEDAQVRPVRELMIDSSNAFAKNKLSALDAQIVALRLQLLP